MYCFAKICCLCLQYNPELINLENMDANGITFFEKLVILVPGFEKLVKKSIPNYTCRKCKRYLNKFFKFQQNCLKSCKLLESYVNQLDTSSNTPELNIIEDDLILIKEDMEKCLKNMEIYIKVEDSSNEETENRSSPDFPDLGEDPNTSSYSSRSIAQNHEGDTSSRKRTRECKKISYNEDYDSDAMVSDSELYYAKGAKRKAKPRKAPPKADKTVVIPQNDVFAKDLTKTINEIITRLSANSDNTSKPQPDEFKVKFKNSSGKTEELSIFQDKDTVEIKFTKEEKMGHLKVHRSGDAFVLTHNMSETSGTSSTNAKTVEQLDPEDPKNLEDPINLDVWKCTICSENFKSCYSLTKHVNNYMNFKEMSCKLCDRTFEHVADLRRHISVHSSSLPEVPENTCSGDLDPENSSKDVKGVLSEIEENPIRSEHSSSPEYQFHLSDDTDVDDDDDDFDNDTIILSSLDNETDFSDTRSEEDAASLETTGNCSNLRDIDFEIKQTKVNSKIDDATTPEDVPRYPNDKETGPEDVILPQVDAKTNKDLNQINNNAKPVKKLSTNGIDVKDSFEEKLLKIIINKTEVDDFMRNKNQEDLKKTNKISPRNKLSV